MEPLRNNDPRHCYEANEEQQRDMECPVGGLRQIKLRSDADRHYKNEADNGDRHF